MHTILLRNIKRHLDFYKESGFLNDNVEKGLSNMPWTAGTSNFDALENNHRNTV